MDDIVDQCDPFVAPYALIITLHMKLSYHENNAYQSVKVMLELANIRFTETCLKSNLLEHHDFPGISAICEVLEEYKIANLAVKIDQTKLAEVPLPALAYVIINGEGTFLTIKKITDVDVLLYHPTKGWVTEALNLFVEKWTGVMLMIEPDANSAEEGYQKNKLKETFANLRLRLLITAMFMCAATALWLCVQRVGFMDNAVLYFLLGCKSIGLAVSFLLLAYEADQDPPLVRQVCQLGNQGCEKVLHSDAAKPFLWLSWSEVGYIYFASSLLFLLLSVIAGYPGLQLIFTMTCLALPYTLYSVYYQAYVAKQWCTLCMTVQALLWTEFYLGLSSGLVFELNVNLLSYGLLLISMLFVIVVWVLFKPHMVDAAKYDLLHREFQKIKFHPDFVQMQQKLKKKLPPLPQGMETVVMGKTDAEHTMVMVMNPMCSECAKAHKDVETLLQKYDNIKCQVVLASSNNPNDEAALVTNHILSMPHESRKEGLQRWFQSLKLETFAGVHPAKLPLEPGASRTWEKSHQWIESAGLKKTPAFYVNDVEYPDLYKVEEMGKMLKVLKNTNTYLVQNQ